MAPTTASEKPSGHNSRGPKLARLPKGKHSDQHYLFVLWLTIGTGAKVSKRPLLRPAIASPYTGSSVQKIVYVSSRSSFMSVVKRVQKLLALASARSTQSVRAGVGDRGDINQIAAALAEKSLQKKPGEEEKVMIKATGKAIEKALGLALWFQQREEYGIEIRTGSVGAIDDIVPASDGEEEKGEVDKEGDHNMDAEEGKDETTTELPESRIRYTSVVEIGVWSK